jgi:ribosomal protein S18 acetylase RimI-like enzyme
MQDVDQLQQLGIASYGHFQSVLTPDHWLTLHGSLHNKQKFIDVLSIAQCFVCKHQDIIVGVAYLVPSGHPTDIFQAEWSYIRMVAVHPTYQGKGIAKTLTKMCIDAAKSNQETTIALHTSEFMDAARHIYEGIGFKVLKEIPLLYGKKYWLYTFDLR